jgi:hypothetical protein
MPKPTQLDRRAASRDAAEWKRLTEDAAFHRHEGAGAEALEAEEEAAELLASWERVGIDLVAIAREI